MMFSEHIMYVPFLQIQSHVSQASNLPLQYIWTANCRALPSQ